MPSTAIQSRIHAFESLALNGSNYPPSTSRINPQGSSSLLEEPISPTAKSFSPIVPSAPLRSFPHSPSPSPPNLGRKTSLIDLGDWVVDDGPAKSSSGVVNSHLNGRRPPPRRSDLSERVEATPLIKLESPPKARSAPPLPPNKRCHDLSDRHTHANGGPSTPKRQDSLAVEHTYPPFLSLDTSGARKSWGHAPASSISSFHSVSLSDGEMTGTPSSTSNFVFTHGIERDSGEMDSLSESFENVSVLSSPVNFMSYDRDNTFVSTVNIPPKLPERPKPRPIPSPSHSPPSSPGRPNIPIGASSRRIPPPPPRANQSRPSSARTSLVSTATTTTTTSDRSSVLSTTATSRTSVSLGAQPHSHSKAPPQLYRPTPVPAAARHRYESVFISTIRAKRKTDKLVLTSGSDLLSPSNSTASAAVGRKVRKAAGWRGLSVDLITNPAENVLAVNDTGNESLESVGSNEYEDVTRPDGRLEGYIVRRIWSCSRLANQKLRDIWCILIPSLLFLSSSELFTLQG